MASKTQTVIIENRESFKLPIENRVPQRSMLSSLLILLYVHDRHNKCSSLIVYHHSDETFVLGDGKAAEFKFDIHAAVRWLND